MNIVANDDTGMWEIHDDAGFVCKLESESTAQLFCAAPELLAALEAMEAVLDGPIGDILTGEDMAKTGAYDALERARAAIAKAEGRAE